MMIINENELEIIDAIMPSEFSDSLWEEYAEIDIADVVVDLDGPDLNQFYSYRVPPSLQNTLAPGMCVHISFNGREALGYVLERRKIQTSDPLCGKLKNIISVVEDAITINEEQMEAVRWMSEHYICKLRDAIRCVAPPILSGSVSTSARLLYPDLRGTDIGESMNQAHIIETLRSLGGEADLEKLKEAAKLKDFSSFYSALKEKKVIIESRQIEKAKVVAKKMKGYTLGASAEILTDGGVLGRRTANQQRVLDRLIDWSRTESRPMPGDELIRSAQVSAATVRGLLQRGLIEASELTVWRSPVSGITRTTSPEMTAEQQNALNILKRLIKTGRTQTALLFGVTASGKTEVYLNAIAHALEMGRSAIVLLPEIALTAQVVDVFIGRFGEQVALLHSRLSEGERHDEWRRMQEGKARIVVGARSAVFAPVKNVGLIVVDEEHEASYKQEKSPRYNAKDIAAKRAQSSKATLVLGSATPSLESYYSTFDAIEGERVPHTLIEMRERVGNRAMPAVEVVDLREEFKHNRSLFSDRLTAAISERLNLKQQTILFLNRRGYAQFVLCRDCGWVAKCENCAVSLAFHSYDRTLKCHHCDYTGRAPQICPDCGGSKVKTFGIGTEKVEEEVLRIFPSARTARMDRDTTSSKGSHSRILRSFRQGESDILIGTQMVAKGLDFPNVTLVGVVSADTSINMPDFRAAERTFQLLTQVAGRAGRGETAGQVIIQTFSPDHYAVQAAMKQDYVSFYEKELKFREELRYPPFSRFVNLISADISERKAQERAELLAAALEKSAPKDIEIIGPSPAPLARIKNQFRFHVALRAPIDAILPDIVRQAISTLSSVDRYAISIDMDPLSMA